MTQYFGPYISIFKALSDETRLRILQMLTCESLCANEILNYFNLTQPSLSYHMKILTGSGLVLTRRQGGFTRYWVNPDRLHEVKRLMDILLEGTAVPNRAEG